MHVVLVAKQMIRQETTDLIAGQWSPYATRYRNRDCKPVRVRVICKHDVRVQRLCKLMGKLKCPWFLRVWE